MRRRNFLKLAGTAAILGLGGGSVCLSCGSPAKKNNLPASASKPIETLIGSNPDILVSLAGIKPSPSNEQIGVSVRLAAEAATDFSWLSKGDVVFIKPVINSGNPYPATTSAMGLSAIIRLLKEKGAGRIIVGDMSGIEHIKLSIDGMKGSSRSLAISSGIAQAVEAAGGDLYFPEEAGWRAFYEEGLPSGSHWKAGVMMPDILKEVDHIILMPRCSRHLLAGSSLGLKAAVGYWRTDSRLEYHRDATTFQEKTAEANFLPILRDKQRLIITVADKVLATFGPDRGYVVTPENGLVFASSSIIAHDMVSLAFLLESRLSVPDSNKQGVKDPNTSQTMVTWANRFVTYLLGGVSEAIRAEDLIRNDLDRIWDDRVLRRGFELAGGIPHLELVSDGCDIPLSLIQRISDATMLPTNLKRSSGKAADNLKGALL